jgi:hypothetical protein
MMNSTGIAADATPYQREQLAAQQMVQRYIASADDRVRSELSKACDGYRGFRRRVDRFLTAHFDDICSSKCYRSRLSACCSRDGIVTFFADLVVNALESTADELQQLIDGLRGPPNGAKCIYLGPQGCRWKTRPLVCAMFLCDSAQAQVLGLDAALQDQWAALRSAAKGFRWPDRPVLFDFLEAHFIAADCRSPLMYLHNSPGLLRVKQRAGLLPPGRLRRR